MHYFRQNDFSFLKKNTFPDTPKKRETRSGLELRVTPHFAKHTAYYSGQINIFFKNRMRKIPTKYA